MARAFLYGVVLLLVLGSCTGASAQDAWPSYPLNGHDLPRGPGGYLSWLKLLVFWILFLLWVKTTDWINRDAQLLKLNHLLWNPVNFFPFYVGFLLIGMNAPFPLGCGFLVLAWLIPLFVYIFQRNANVERHEKVLTPEHMRYLAATVGSKLGMNIKAEKTAPHERGAPVDFKPLSGANEAKNQAALIMARQSESFVSAKDLMADAINRRSEKLMLDFEGDDVAVRYQIDGVWHEADPQDAESAGATLAVFKTLASVNPQERRQRQTGDLSVVYNDEKYTAKLVAQGTKTGERAIVHLVQRALPFASLAEAGMRPKMQEQLHEVLSRKSGLFIFSAIPGGGLSTTMALAEKMLDRYMRDFVSFQAVDHPEPVADNVEIETFDGAQGSGREKLVSLFRKDPDVVIVHDLGDQKVAELVCERATNDKMVLTSIRAKEAVEALLRVLLLKVPAKSFAPVVLGVLNQRLIRRLCEDCKEEYAPAPDLLKKLGIPAGRVESLFKPPEADEDQPVCTQCGGLGYHGRTSIFELMIVDDAIREALIKQPKLETLRKLSRAAGNRSLQEEGVVLVAQGVTSVAELTRVLKQ